VRLIIAPTFAGEGKSLNRKPKAILLVFGKAMGLKDWHFQNSKPMPGTSGQSGVCPPVRLAAEGYFKPAPCRTSLAQ